MVHDSGFYSIPMKLGYIWCSFLRECGDISEIHALTYAIHFLKRMTVKTVSEYVHFWESYENHKVALILWLTVYFCEIAEEEILKFWSEVPSCSK